MRTRERLRCGSVPLMIICLLLMNAFHVAFAQRRGSHPSTTSQSQRSDVIPEDTVISVRINEYLSSRTSKVGDKFTATVSTPVYVVGQIAIPAGSIIEGRITQVLAARRMNKPGTIAVEFDSISLPNGLSTQIVGVLTSDNPEIQKQIDEENRMSGGKSQDNAVFIGSSGAIGAILGAISGGAKGAAVGGAIGAGIGLAGVMMKKGEDASVPAGTAFGIRLKQALPSPTLADNVGGEPANQPQNDNANPDPAAQTRAESAGNPTNDRTSTIPDDPRPSRPNPSGDAPVTSEPEREPVESEEKTLPLSSSEMIRRAQIALTEEGYYEGEVNGEMNTRTTAAIKTYQHEKNLPETGTLDEATAKSLKIIGSKPAVPRPVRNNDAAPSVSQNDTNRSVQNRPEKAVNQSTQSTTSTGNSTSVQVSGDNHSASSILKQAQDLLAEYQRMIGVRLTGTGLESDGRTVYTDDDIDLLFALDSFANRVQLYARLLPTLQSQQGIRSATLAMAKEARRTDRIVTTSSSRWINRLNPRWDAIRQEILRLMYTYSISTSEIEN